jgi:alkylhydroperoxidase/carboxymuconolactone decarboxylase family protein YurZ
VNQDERSREERNRAGWQVREAMKHGSRGGSTNASVLKRAPSLGEYTTELVFGSVWARPRLGQQRRMICTLAALSASHYFPQLRTYVHSAADLGLSRKTLQEVAIQVGWYAGAPAMVTSLAVIGAAFEERDPVEEPPDQAPDESPLDELRAHGEKRAATAELKATSGLEASLDDLEAIYSFGLLWNRPGLEPADRACVGIAASTALAIDEELERSVAIALSEGLETEDIAEAILQAAAYCGFPRARHALRVLEQRNADAALDPEDEIAILRLIALYGHIADEGQFDRMDELFTQDAVFDTTAAGSKRLEGLEAIRQHWSTVRQPVAHHGTNVVITPVGPGEAMVVSKGVTLFPGEEQAFTHANATPIAPLRTSSIVYRDRVVKTPAGWRLAERRGERRTAAG